MTTVELTSAAPAKIRTEAIVLATTLGSPRQGTRPGASAASPTDAARQAGSRAQVLGLESLPKAARTAIEQAAQAVRATGAAEEVVRLPAPAGLQAELLILTGTGAQAGSTPTDEQLRRAAGAGTRALAGSKDAALVFPLTGPASVGAVAEGALLGTYRFAGYRTGDAPVGGLQLVVADAKDADTSQAVERARTVAAAVNDVRDLVNTAPNELYPESFADRAAEAARGSKVSVSVLDEKALRDGGYGGLIGVGQGSARGPRLVRVEWKPRRAHSHYALVGKGITFDSGGLSLKPAKSMETMKCDMAGAAVVLHTVLAAARLKLPVRVTGWLALAENLPSATAQRPSDVLTIRGGTTVEVLNTDAEGRLVLADALVAAGEEDPDVLVDVATLTGAQMVALGNQVGAVMGSEEVRGSVIAAADAAGEQMWPMPLPEELAASMKSQVADLANIGDRFGGMLVAGLFLKRFTDGRPWAHLDIAGPAFNEGSPRHYVPKGGTGVGVRTLVTLLEHAAAG